MGWLRTSRTGAVVIVIIALAGCGSTSPTASLPAPSGAAASGAPSTLPAPSIPASVAPSEAPTATAAGAPTPTGTPAPTPATTHWVVAGAYGDLPVDDLVAARLGSGRVLFLGTLSNSETSQSVPFASAWDPASGATETVAALPKLRSQAVVVSLRDGRVLVAGGLNGSDRYSANAQSYSSAYAFSDTQGGAWAKVGLLHQARTAPCAAVLNDGRVLVAGGYFYVAPNFGLTDPGVVLAVARDTAPGAPGLADMEPPDIGTAMATAELFDPATGSWSAAGAMHYARTGCAATTLSDGRVLIAGSTNGDGVRVPDQALSTAEVFDPTTGKFTLTAGMVRPSKDKFGPLHDLWPQGISGHSPGRLAPLPDGGALLVGDSTSFKHEGSMTRTLRWTPPGGWSDVGPTYAYYGDPGGTPTIRTPGARDMTSAAVVALADGRVTAIGGEAADKGPGWGAWVTVGTVDAWSVGSGRWSALPSLTVPRSGGVGVVLADGSIIVAGGWSPTSADNSDPVTSIARLGVGP